MQCGQIEISVMQHWPTWPLSAQILLIPLQAAYILLFLKVFLDFHPELLNFHGLYLSDLNVHGVSCSKNLICFIIINVGADLFHQTISETVLIRGEVLANAGTDASFLLKAPDAVWSV